MTIRRNGWALEGDGAASRQSINSTGRQGLLQQSGVIGGKPQAVYDPLALRICGDVLGPAHGLADGQLTRRPVSRPKSVHAAAGTGGRKDVLGAELFPVRNKKVPRAHPGHRRICRIIVHPPDESRIRWVQRPSMAADGRDVTLAAARAPGDGSSDENASKMRHTTLT